MLRDFLEDHGLSQAKLAADPHVSPQLLNDLLASRRLLTPEHCLKLGRHFGNEPEYWMRLQNVSAPPRGTSRPSACPGDGLRRHATATGEDNGW